MKNTIILSLVSLFACASIFAQDVESTPIASVATPTTSLYEIGLVFPIFSDDARTFINGSNISPNPLSTGFGTGIQLGYHKVMGKRATLGGIVNTTAFVDNSTTTTQVYQFAGFAVGRVSFMENWSNSLFAEVGVGPELAAYSINGGNFNTQVSLASRFGLGYNYSFDNNVCLTVSAVVSPNFSSNDPTRNAKIIIGMIW